MNYYTLEELKAKIVAGLDVFQFLDVLDISFAELVDAFEEKLVDRYEDIVLELGEEPFF